MNSFNLSRLWFAFCYENSETRPIHTALYFWILERGNASGWKKVIDIQTAVSMEALGLKDWRTYREALQFLHDNNFIIWVEKSKNQWTCNRITIISNPGKSYESLKNAYANFAEADAEAHAEALAEANPKAYVKALAEALQSYINLKTNKPINLKTNKQLSDPDSDESEPDKNIEDSKEVFTAVKNYFLEFYKEQKKEAYIFGKIDAGKIKPLLKKIHFKVKEKNGGESANAEQLIFAAQYFFQQAYATGDTFIQNNFTLAILDSKFNSIFSNFNHARKQNQRGSALFNNQKGRKPDTAGLSEIANWHTNGHT